MQERIEKILKDSKIVSNWDKVKEEKRGEFSMFEFKVNICGESELRVKEIWRSDERLRYSYFWIKEGKVLMGWNNSPHHPKLPTYPFHAHRGREVIEWGEVNLCDVIEYVAGENIC